jgi:glycosyltransferase involved in cell wall biosynthesis
VREVSVILPTHDRIAWLRQSLRSVLWQKDVDLEVIVVDDGSTEETGRFIVSLGDPRIVLIRHDRSQGVSAARNHGAEEATGQWLAFLDDDDVWGPEKLSRQLQAAKATGRRWVYTGSVNVDDTLRILGGKPPPTPDEVLQLIYRQNVIPGGGSNVAVRRDELERAGPFDLRLKNTEDWEMWMRFASQGPPAYVSEPLVAYRLHAANASLDVKAVFEGIDLIERRHGIKVARGVVHRWIAASFLRTGKRANALRHFALAAVDGELRGVAGDVRLALEWRVDRYVGRQPKTLPQLPNPAWTARAKEWLDEFSARLALDAAS